MLVHSVCGGTLFVHNDFYYCDICCRVVPLQEIEGAQETPALLGTRTG